MKRNKATHADDNIPRPYFVGAGDNERGGCMSISRPISTVEIHDGLLLKWIIT